MLSGTVPRWSPDFPRSFPCDKNRDRPTLWRITQ
jgi:hypothetical protein